MIKNLLILGPFSFNPPIITGDKNNPVIGAGGVPVVNQVHSLKKYTKYNLSLITLTPELFGKSAIHNSLQGFNTYIAGMNNNHGVKNMCRYEINNIQKCISKINYDFIISNFTVEYSLATLRQKKPYTIVVHDYPWQILKTQKFHPYWIIRYFISLFIYKRGKSFVAVNNYVGNYVKKWTKGNVEIVGNPLKEAVFNLYNTNRFKKGFYKDDNIKVVSVLSWGELKNSKNGIMGFAEFKKAYNNSEYLLIGPGLGEKEEAHCWAKNKNLADGIKFIGRVPNDEVYRYLDESHILLHPSKEEAASTIISEAIAIGLPVVAGKYSGGVPEQLNYGKYGALVNVSSPVEIKNGLVKTIRDIDITKNRIEMARRFAIENNHPKIFSFKIESLINKELNRRD